MQMAVDLSVPVLVVEKSRIIGQLIRALLIQIGFTDFDLAPGGTIALAMMRERRYGLIISDWNMEPMNGLELLKEIRQDVALGRILFILVCAESNLQQVEAAKAAGVDGFIVKPFTAAMLRAEIEAIFDAKHSDGDGDEIIALD
jgi:two-component system chemotaxis response regulator CheY